MRVGKKRYRLSTCIKRWFLHNFSKQNIECNYQCAFGVRSEHYKDNKCMNRWHPVRCAQCWRASELKLKRKLREY